MYDGEWKMCNKLWLYMAMGVGAEVLKNLLQKGYLSYSPFKLELIYIFVY